jgi:hypothetical protein
MKENHRNIEGEMKSIIGARGWQVIISNNRGDWQANQRAAHGGKYLAAIANEKRRRA